MLIRTALLYKKCKKLYYSRYKKEALRAKCAVGCKVQLHCINIYIHGSGP